MSKENIGGGGGGGGGIPIPEKKNLYFAKLSGRKSVFCQILFLRVKNLYILIKSVGMAGHVLLQVTIPVLKPEQSRGCLVKKTISLFGLVCLVS